MRFLCLFIGCLAVAGCDRFYEKPTVVVASERWSADLETDEYGVPVSLFESTSHTVRRNETVIGILTGLGIDSQVAHEVLRQSGGAINPNRIVPGHLFTLYTPLEDESLPVLLVYEPDPRRYVVATIGAEIQVDVQEREVSVRSAYAEGVINGSLYETLMRQSASPALAVAMADVFAWQVDFYRIQRGDAFKVIYDEEVMNGKPIGVGRIRSAWFKHAGKEFVALYVEQDGRGDYYDMDGNSARKAFLKAPLKFSRISSRFTNRRFHPVLQRNMPHHGTDYAAPTGTPILAVGDAVVTQAGFSGGNGNFVRLKHNSTYETGYLHMSRIAPGIRKGVRVSQGQVIGYVGSTGLATGPHLCYRFWRNGQPVDPHRIEFPSSEPIAAAYREEFDRTKTERYLELTRPAILRAYGGSSLAILESAIAPVPPEPIFKTF